MTIEDNTSSERANAQDTKEKLTISSEKVIEIIDAGHVPEESNPMRKKVDSRNSVKRHINNPMLQKTTSQKIKGTQNDDKDFILNLGDSAQVSKYLNMLDIKNSNVDSRNSVTSYEANPMPKKPTSPKVQGTQNDDKDFVDLNNSAEASKLLNPASASASAPASAPAKVSPPPSQITSSPESDQYDQISRCFNGIASTVSSMYTRSLSSLQEQASAPSKTSDRSKTKEPESPVKASTNFSMKSANRKPG